MPGVERPDSDRGQAGKLAARRRNAALGRLHTAKRWLIGGSVAATCALAIAIEALAPGHSVASASAAPSSSGDGSTSSHSSSSVGGSSGNSGAGRSQNSGLAESSGNSGTGQLQGSSSVTQSSGYSQSSAAAVSGGS